MSLRWTRSALSLGALGALLALGGCDGCGAVSSDPDGGGSAGADRAASDAGDTTPDGGDLDGAEADADPLQQNLPDFCEGTGTVVSIGADAICAGDLATQTFRFALCACEEITTTAQLTLDSFDSAEGPYGGDNVHDDGQLGLNAGPLLLDHKLTVRGSAYVGGGGLDFGPGSEILHNLFAYGTVDRTGPGADVSIGRNAYVNGDVGSPVNIAGDLVVPASATVSGSVAGTITRQDIPQILPCPCATDQILDIAGLTGWAASNNDNEVFVGPEDGGVEDRGAGGLDPTEYEDGGPARLVLPCGRFYLTAINQGGDALDIVVTDRAVLFVDGDLSAHRFTITVEEGGELDLFVAGDLIVGAAADFGSERSPASVRTYVGGNLSFQAAATFAGNVYAPHADINFGAQTDIYGSLMVRNVAFTAAANVHFDSAIRLAGETCAEPGDPDGGVTTPDGGAGVDSGAGEDGGAVGGCSGLCSFECGYEACLMEPGQSSGVCGPCASDLDCCAPLLCDTGSGLCYITSG